MTRKSLAELRKEFEAIIRAAAEQGATPQQVVAQFGRALFDVLGSSITSVAARLQIELLERLMDK